MSVINKILGGLKKSGASAPSVQAAARMDDAMKKRVMGAALGMVALLAASVGGWLWWGGRQKAAVPQKVAQVPARPIAAAQPQPAAIPVAASGVEAAHEAAASQPVVAQPELAAAGHEAPPINHEPEAAAHKEAAREITPPAKAEPVRAEKYEAPASSPRKEAVAEKPAPRKREPEPVTEERKAEVAALDAAPALQEKQPQSAPARPPVAEGRKKPRKSATAAVAATAKPEAASGVEAVDKQVKPLTDKQQAENEFRKANSLVQQGRYGEALEGYGSALQLDAAHDAARRAMVGLLLQSKRNTEAERLLQEGLKLNIRNGDFAMLLARIQIERDASWSALLTLQKTLPYAEQRADYRAFVAALLQRLDRNREAVMHYQAAVQLSPDSGVWWMGLGISLRAIQRDEEAKDAFRHALETGVLNADLQAYVERQIRDL